MKTAAAKITSTALHLQKKENNPFFSKSEDGSFFSKSNRLPQPFFSTAPIQPKLTIGQPNDIYEKEADSMADKVVQRLSDPSSIQTKSNSIGYVTPFVQKKCDHCEEEEKLQKKEKDEIVKEQIQKKPIFESNAEPPDDDSFSLGKGQSGIQRKCAECEKEEKLQKKELSHPSVNMLQKQAIGGPALAATPAAQSSALPASVITQWQAHIRANQPAIAVNDIIAEMIRRGEINPSIYRVQQTSTGAPPCQTPNPQLITVNSSVNGANTQQCPCVTIGSSKYANPRMEIHDDLVRFITLGSTTPQTNATILHSTLLHEFRHVRQQYEECNTPGIVTSSGLCTDCNNPEEMDAYLAEIEAGYSQTAIMNAWVRVFVNWNYLSPAQQSVFSARKQAAEAKVNSLFPGVTWNTNQRVIIYQQWCQSIQGGAVGTCNSFMTPSTQAGSSQPNSPVQRKCTACEKEEKLQKKSDSTPQTAPPNIESSLNSSKGSGSQLPQNTREQMENSFGTNFSGVRIHNDSSSVQMNKDLQAQAFTHGSDIYFNSGKYNTNSTSGKHLLAHELTHVVQQSGRSLSSVSKKRTINKDESTKFQTLQKYFKGTSSIQLRVSPYRIQRQKSNEFPGFSQGDAATCGAASLISALIIWDKEKQDPNMPNEMVVTACNIILIHMDDNKKNLIKSFDDQGMKGEDFYNYIFSELTRIRDFARQPGSKISSSDYQLISNSLVILFRSASSGGLSKGDIEAIQTKLGLSTGIQSNRQAQSFDDIFADLVLKNLKPGQIAQISWYTKDKQGNLIVSPIHAFLIGHFKKGNWFLSDQGMNPPTEKEAATLEMLKSDIWSASKKGESWIYTGIKPMLLPAPFTGVTLLGDSNSVEKQAQNLILKPGDFIAEVDATIICCGEKLYAWDFVARRYSFAEAELTFGTSGSGHGGLIIENPLGLFHVFKINPISDKKNLLATSIDEGDSKGGYLMKKEKYYHAWLKLCSAGPCSSSFFKYR